MELRIPGDKSITQRALILAGLSEKRSVLRNVLLGADPQATAEVLRKVGVPLPPLHSAREPVSFSGVGLHGLRSPSSALDCKNSGTGARLLLGALAAQRFVSTITGDQSLRSRPMGRVTRPLRAMGAEFRELGEPGCLPLLIRGGPLRPLEYHTPVASAQIKSALLLAGLAAGVPVRVVEPIRSRDHTERLLEAVGVPVKAGPDDGGWRVESAAPPSQIGGLELDVPGDFSSAAFLTVFGLLQTDDGQELVLRNVGLNSTRTGLLDVLGRMGAHISVDGKRRGGQGEPWGDLVVKPQSLRGTEVDGAEIPGSIDEIPILAVAASRAEGRTRITGAAELRVKESDRLVALRDNLRALGVPVEELADGLEIEGSDRPLRGRVRSYGDHRIAMAFGVLASLPGCEIEVEGPDVAEWSYPGILVHAAFHRGGRRLRLVTRRKGSGERRVAKTIVTIDGPAGSGKSSTARALAARLHYRHLDSGALYRALTHAILEDGISEAEWPHLTRERLERIPLGLHPEGGGFQILLRGAALREELRTERVTRASSRLARFPPVRARLLGLQREAGGRGRVVCEGRDMGTVVFPDAGVKVFLTASLKERARRRFLERTGREPGREELELEANALRMRDDRDRGRGLSPLRKPEDAFELDSSTLSFEEQVQTIVRWVWDLTEPSESG